MQQIGKAAHARTWTRYHLPHWAEWLGNGEPPNQRSQNLCQFHTRTVTMDLKNAKQKFVEAQRNHAVRMEDIENLQRGDGDKAIQEARHKRTRSLAQAGRGT